MRFSHKLKHNKSTCAPQRFITMDTESFCIDIDENTKMHTLKFGVCRYYRKGRRGEEFVFYTVKDYWNWISDKCQASNSKTYLFAHNQQFDSLITGMFVELPKRGWILEKQIIDSNIFIVEWFCPLLGHRLVCLDTFNYFKTSLATLGEHLGIKKNENEINILERMYDPIVSEEDIIYCKRDVEITERVLLEWFRFIEINDLGMFRPTVAGQAFASFRHRFMKHEIFIHDNEKAIELERESYRGGRNEAFRIGEINENLYCYDFNSLYPSVMVDNLYPRNLVKYRKYNNIDTLKEDMKKYLVIAELYINIDKPLFGVKKERLIFPVGKFKGVFCSPEIERLIKDNSIISVGRVACYEGDKIFKDYVEFFYNERLKSKDKFTNELFKLMLNSLYGKFGQKVRENSIIGHCDPYEIGSILCEAENDDGTFTAWKETRFGGNVYMSIATEKESMHSFPAIASFCTTYARMRLLEAIEIAGWENVYYTDTDSLFVNSAGKERLENAGLVDAKKLGKMKLEYWGRRMKIRGCKDYIFIKNLNPIDSNVDFPVEIIKIKGVNKHATQKDENIYINEKMDKFRTSVKHGTLNCVIQRNVEKKLSREYIKGIVFENGDVKPIELMESVDFDEE